MSGAHGLETAKENLDAIWTGQAAKAAVDYTQRLINSTTETQGHVIAISKTLSDLANFITDAYTNAIDNIIQCAEKIVGFAGDIVGVALEISIGGIAKSIAGLINGFLDVMRKIIRDINEYFKNVASGLNGLTAEASKVKVPGEVAMVVTDQRYWTPN
ncbi:hypothetical protein ACW9HQ_51805, partial [Nocardia gipuzkoensis]